MTSSEKLTDFINKKILSKKGLIVDENSLLFKDKYLDSITILSLIGYIEKELERKITDEEISLENFKSINAIVTKFKL